jgi:hypothetical protein
MTLNRSQQDVELDLSLRLWSDRIPLEPIVRRLGFSVQNLHVAGQPIPRHRGAAARVAHAHYASTANFAAHEDTEVLNWIRHTLEGLSKDPQFETLLRSGEIEATLWIAVLASRPMPSPNLPADVLSLAKALNLSILSENYTVPNPPEKIWLSRSRAARQVAN